MKYKPNLGITSYVAQDTPQKSPAKDLQEGDMGTPDGVT